MNHWKSQIQQPVHHLAEQLRGFRSGALSVGIVETFRVEIRGSSVPLRKLASIARQGDRITVSPFDKANVTSIVRALTDAKWNAYALNPSTVAVGIPPISGEQQAQLLQHVKKLGEEAKIAVRSVRQALRKQIAAGGRGSERAVQEATDAAVAEIQQLVRSKQAELRS